jgi:hypothetical protein
MNTRSLSVRLLSSLCAFLALAGCSLGQNLETAQGGALPSAVRLTPHRTSPSDFNWIEGNLIGGTGYSKAVCPKTRGVQWKMVAGGAYYNAISDYENPGAPNFQNQEWDAYPPYGTEVRAYVSCVAPSIASHFQWISEDVPIDGHFGAECPSSQVMITGYAATTPQWAIWPGNQVNTYYAWTDDPQLTVSCGDKTVIGAHQNQSAPPFTGELESTCPPGSILVGGTTGSYTYYGWPRDEYPAAISGTHTATSWLVFTGWDHIINQIACAPTS